MTAIVLVWQNTRSGHGGGENCYDVIVGIGGGTNGSSRNCSCAATSNSLY